MSRREQLLRVVDEDIHLDRADYRLLHALMQTLHGRLLARDCGQILSINTLIQTHLETLRIRARRRARILAAFGLSPGTEAMSQLFELTRAPRRAQLQDAWAELTQSLRTCRQLNERNGSLLALQSDIANQLFGRQRGDFLYAPLAE